MERKGINRKQCGRIWPGLTRWEAVERKESLLQGNWENGEYKKHTAVVSVRR